jgi:tetratricopeptide (TPR) repeat protein
MRIHMPRLKNVILKQACLGALLCLNTGMLNSVPVQAYTKLTPHWYANQAQAEGQRAEVLLRQHRYLEAYNAASIAIRYLPTGTMAASHYNTLGFCYLGMKEPALAAASFEYAIRLHPTHAIYYENLVRAWMSDAHTAQKVKALSDYLRYNPPHADAWYLLGVFYHTIGDADGAQAAWEQHLLLAPRSPFEALICERSPHTCHKLKELKRLER